MQNNERKVKKRKWQIDEKKKKPKDREDICELAICLCWQKINIKFVSLTIRESKIICVL